jgi:hyperosmotically inducible protein
MTPKASATLILALLTGASAGFTAIAASEPAPPQVTDVDRHAMPPAQPAPVPQPAPQSQPAPQPQPAPPKDIEHYSLPSVSVTAPRLSEDERLRNAVMDRLAADSHIHGLIGVESYRNVVSLTGRVTTTLQKERAETIARGIEGVRDVNNYLTARVGST